MNKLVSNKNSIQRFKQGRIIEKFQNPAGPVRHTPGGQPIQDTYPTNHYNNMGFISNIARNTRKAIRKGYHNQILDNTITEGLYKGYFKSLESNTPVSNTPISFSQAFRQARNSGLKEFTWNGNRYTTETAEEKRARLQQNNIRNKVSFQVPVTTETTQQDWDRLKKAREKVWAGATFAKQGGSLVSRNPIKRFKLNFRLVDQ